jgi:glycerophosphoryl diester phosphodiesterase
MVERAHANGIICNAFFADTKSLADEYLDMGVDVILTNDYHTIAEVVAKRKKYVNY